MKKKLIIIAVVFLTCLIVLSACRKDNQDIDPCRSITYYAAFYKLPEWKLIRTDIVLHYHRVCQENDLKRVLETEGRRDTICGNIVTWLISGASCKNPATHKGLY